VSEVAITYARLPDREEVFRQRLVEDAGEYVVTYLPEAAIRAPLEVGGRTVLEPGAPVVWFTYPGRWYDIGRFHLRDGTFTGFYANVLTPVEMDGLSWRTTDLCLDLWVGVDGRIEVLDEREFAEAVDAGWIDTPTATTARETVETLGLLADQGSWPPDHAREWTLEGVRAMLGDPAAPAPAGLTPDSVS
jgi:predicted RNA-binding protein associated with RNAse of E/G family